MAVGGTAGGPNVTDHFVLRLEEDPAGTGTARVPHAYYSYYHDLQQSNQSYEPIQSATIWIDRPDGIPVPVPYWRAGSFGLILPDLAQAKAYVDGYPTSTPPPMPIVYGERVDPSSQSPPRWRVDTRNPLPKMRYWAAPQQDANGLITSPMVVTLRAPMDRAVAGDPRDLGGEARHWLLNRDFWEIAHATSVFDVMPRTNAGFFPVNVCAVDDTGQVFTSQLGAIPVRGDDAAICLFPRTCSRLHGARCQPSCRCYSAWRSRARSLPCWRRPPTRSLSSAPDHSTTPRFMFRRV